MKISSKTGKVKLEKDEIRVGNFFLKREADHMKLQDLNSVMSHRVSRRIPIGIWLENFWAGAMNGNEGAVDTLKTYIATMWSFFSVAPDDQYIKEALDCAHSALERHPDWYGFKAEGTVKEDDEAIKEVKEMTEFEQEVKDFVEKEEAAGPEEQKGE